MGAVHSFARSVDYKSWATLLVVVPGGYAVYWERRRLNFLSKLAEEKRKAAERAPDYPYYGKSWGMSTDYSIETGLQNGDILFLKYSEGPMHLHDCLLNRLCRRYSNTSYGSFDDVGIILWKHGQCYVVTLGTHGTVYTAEKNPAPIIPFKPRGLVLERYCDKLARTCPSAVTLRRLQCSPSVRERIPGIIAEMTDDWKETKRSRLLEYWMNKTEKQRCSEPSKTAPSDSSVQSILDEQGSTKSWWPFDNTQSADTTRPSNMFEAVGKEIARQWEVLAHRYMIARLEDVLGNDVCGPAHAEKEDLAEGVEQPAQVTGATTLLNLLEHLKSELQILWSVSTLRVPEKVSMYSKFLCWVRPALPFILSRETTERHEDTGVRERDEPTQKMGRYMTAAGFVVDLYQRANLLPKLPRAELWDAEDLLLLDYLCCGSADPMTCTIEDNSTGNIQNSSDEPIDKTIKGNRLLPKLSAPCHVRDDSLEKDRLSIVTIFRKRPPVVSGM